MDMGNLGKWAFWIALVVAVLNGILHAFSVTALDSAVISDLVALLAVLGGIFYLAGMDRTNYLITALAFAAFSTAAGGIFVAVLGDLVAGILGGAAFAAAAGAAGVLLVVVYEWLMP